MHQHTDKSPRMRPRTVHSTVPIVLEGKPTAKIVTPASEIWRPFAEQVVQLIEKWTGVRLPVVEPGEVLREDGALLTNEAKRTSLLFTGNVAVNAALFEPYMRRFLVADDTDPGQPLLQVHPNPWGGGAGIVLVGSSTPNDVERALVLFEEHAQQHVAGDSLALPRIWLPGPDRLLEAAKGWRRMARPSNDPWLDSLYKSGPLHLGYENGRQIHEATAIGDLGLFDSDELNDIEQQMLDMALMIPKRVWWFAGPDIQNGKVAGRHENFKNTRLLHMVDYLLHVSNPDDEARRRLEEIRQHIHHYYDYILTKANRNDHEGAEESMGWASILWHALIFGRWQYFDSGRAYEAAFHLFLSTDNLGGAAVHAQYGQVDEPNFPTELLEVLRCTEWKLRDGRWRWLIENMPYPTRTHYGFPLRLPIDDVEPKQPNEWLGVQSQPLAPHAFDESIIDKRWKQPNVKREDTADLLTFRSGFNADDQYLALDAFQNQFQPLGLASVLRYVDRGKVWLVAHTGAEGNYEKSGLAVSRGAMEAEKQDVGEPWGSTVAIAQDHAFGYGALKSEDYHDTDWTRHILWKKGEYFLFFDHVKARRQGPFNLTVTWRTLHPAEMVDGRWVQQLDDLACTIEASEPLKSQAGREPEAKYQAERVPFLLRQYKPFAAPNGNEQTCIVNLVATRDRNAPQPEIRKLAENTVIVRTPEAFTIYGIGDWQAGTIHASTTAFVMNANEARVVGGEIRIGDELIAQADHNTVAQSQTQFDLHQQLTNLWEQAAPPGQEQEASNHQTQPLKTTWSCDRLEPHHQRLHPPQSGGRLTSGSWKDTVDDGDGSHATDWRADFESSVLIDHVLAVAESEQLEGGEHWPEFGTQPAMPVPVELDTQSEEACQLLFDGDRQRGRLNQRLVGPTGKSFFKQQTVLRYEGKSLSSIELKLPRGLPLHSVELYGPRTAPAQVVQLAFLNQDDQTIFARTEDHQVICLDANGEIFWHKQFDAPLLAASAIETPAGPRLVMADAACGLWQLTRDGEVEQHAQMEAQSEIAAEFFDQGLIQNRIYSIGTWRRPDAKESSLFFGSYQSVAWKETDGSLNWLPPNSNDMVGRRGFAWRGLIYWDRVLPAGVDMNGDGVEDQAILGRGYATSPYLILFDGKTREPFAEHIMPNGHTLHLSIQQIGGELRVLAVNAFQALVSDMKGNKIWSRRFDTPATAAVTHDGDLYVCKDDGMLLRFDPAGRIVAQSEWAPGSTDLAVNDKHVCIVGPGGIRVTDLYWGVPQTVNCPARKILSIDNESFLVASLDGRIVKLSSE